jgi:DNA-directed RNA polymerase subunit RPC12/RpoP
MARCPECGRMVGRWDPARITNRTAYRCRGCGTHIRPKRLGTILWVVVALTFANVVLEAARPYVGKWTGSGLLLFSALIAGLWLGGFVTMERVRDGIGERSE